MRVNSIDKHHVELSHNGNSLFFSYGTLVGGFGAKGIFVTKDWNYSPATTRHLAKYLNHTIKELRRNVLDGSFEHLSTEDFTMSIVRLDEHGNNLHGKL